MIVILFGIGIGGWNFLNGMGFGEMVVVIGGGGGFIKCFVGVIWRIIN